MDKLKSLQNQISFFIDCYQHENQNTRIEKIGKDNVEMFHVSQIDDDLKFLSEGIQIFHEYGIKAAQILRVYRKEKEVKVYFLGIKNGEDIVPLFVYDAKLEYDYRNRIYMIHINFDSLFINTRALEKCTEYELETLKSIENKLYELAKWKEISKLFLLGVWTIFDEYKISYTYLPTNTDKENVIESILSYGIVKKSKNTRGVKEDLKSIVNLKEHKSLNQYSDPVRALFTSENKTSSHNIELDYKLLPYTLSYGQYRIFDSIKKNNLSLLIGPPGTGKTFTLVSLVLEAVRTGKSILICAKTDQALDVIEKKLKQEFDNHDLILRVGLGNQVKKLKQIIADFKNKKKVRPVSSSEIKRQRKRAKTQYDIIHKLETEIKRQLEIEENYGGIVYKSQKSLQEKLELFFLKFKISKENTLAQKVSRLKKLYKARYIVNKKLINLEHDYRIFKNYTTINKNLTFYQKSLVSRTSITYDAHREKVDFSRLIEILPIWIVNISDMNRSIPLKQGLFDFVFMDEASQCEVTLGIPALQRAKKAVIAGDPKQLNHVSFLPNNFIEYAKKQYNLEDKAYYNYRKYSLLDMVDAVTFYSDNEGILEEHYRSQPSLIGFNNDYFYGNKLRVMTAHGSHKEENCIHFIPINGKQRDDNSNNVEINNIIDRVQEIYASDKEKFEPKTIGIISPFRNQADALKRNALKNLKPELLERHDVLIGTPFEFQGEERDVVFISLAVDNNSASGSFAYLSKENMLNVATSRAKTTQYVIYSFDKERLPKGGLLYLFFEFEHHYIREKGEVRDLFAREVKLSLIDIGVKSISQDETISGTSIDLLLHGDKNDLCIDLIGYEGVYDNVLNLEEIESLFRSDKYVYILPYRHWEKNKTKEIETIYNEFVRINV